VGRGERRGTAGGAREKSGGRGSDSDSLRLDVDGAANGEPD